MYDVPTILGKEEAVVPLEAGSGRRGKTPPSQGRTAGVARQRKEAAIGGQRGSEGNAPAGGKPEAVRVRLLGRFSVSVGDRTVREDA